MTVSAPDQLFPRKAAFDSILKACQSELLSFTEAEALEEAMWQHGEDASLREDIRFRPTPWGRWIVSVHYLANESIYQDFHREDRVERPLSEALEAVAAEVGRTCVFCPADPRFEIREGLIRFSSSELSDQPRIEDVEELERYQTHLPVHTLQAVAASEPAGEWGSQAQEDVINTLGWIRVDLPGKKLNKKMFIARIKGHSMDDGKQGLTNGKYAVFELWPEGTRQNEIVLARGSFSDPETGNYALKRYEGDRRDENREHQEIRLVSLHEDKTRYPDIVLTSEDATDVAVVAKLIAPLDPNQFRRRPKPARRKGQRDLSSEEGRKKIQQDLRKAVERFFEAEAKEERESEDRSGWAAQLVCLDMEAEGLAIETVPLQAFPSFVKTLHLVSGETAKPVIASNLRHRSCRTVISPSLEPYRWTAPDFEEMLDEDLAKLEVEGLPADELLLFRVDSAGIGRLASGRQVSPGQHYRVVLPPKLSVDLSEEALFSLGDGWNLLELELSSILSSHDRDLLKRLDLSSSKAKPIIEWAGPSPLSYSSNRAGEIYPVFAETASPTLRVTGIETEEEGEFTVFVVSEESAEALPLPAGEEWWVALSDLEPGSYVVESVHQKTSVARTRLPFQVSDQGKEWPTSQLSLEECFGQDLEETDTHAADDEGLIEWEGDLRSLFSDEEKRSLTLRAPVYRSVPVFWDDGIRRHLTNLYGDEESRIELVAEMPQLQALAERCPIGTLELDLNELGIVRLFHKQEVEISEVFSFLRDRLEKRGAELDQLRGQYSHLRALWLDDILSQFYHGVSDWDPDKLDQLPLESGATVLLVHEAQRTLRGIVRKPRRVIVLVKSEEDVLTHDQSEVLALADSACRQVRLKEAVITDGVHWRRYTPGRKVQHASIDLRAALAQGEESEEFNRLLIEHSITV